MKDVYLVQFLKSGEIKVCADEETAIRMGEDYLLSLPAEEFLKVREDFYKEIQEWDGSYEVKGYLFSCMYKVY